MSRIENVSRIITYLNNKLKSRYSSTDTQTVRLICDKLDNYKPEDFKVVIDNMHSWWGNDPEMKQHLGPKTLFGKNFDDYLNKGQKPDLSKPRQYKPPEPPRKKGNLGVTHISEYLRSIREDLMEKNKLICKEYLDGIDPREIAAKYNVDRATVYNIHKRYLKLLDKRFIKLPCRMEKRLEKYKNPHRMFLGVVKRKEGKLNMYTKCIYCGRCKFVEYQGFKRGVSCMYCRGRIVRFKREVGEFNSLHGDSLYSRLI